MRATAGIVIPRPDALGLLTHNVPLKLAALGIALVMWLTQSQGTEELTRPFEGTVAVERANMPEGYVLRGSLGTVNVSVRGTEADLRPLAVSSFRAEVDLSQYDLRRVGDLQELPVQVRVSRDSVRVVEIRPSVVTARLVPVEAKRMTVQVRFENQPPSGYQSDPPALQPAEVEVRGPADALREVVSVIVQVRFADLPNDVQVTPRVLPVDAAGREVADVGATPQNVAVAVGVRAATPTRTVGVIPAVSGQPASGYWVAAATTDPAVVTVRGDPRALDAFEQLQTVAIDVSGASADRVVRAALVLPRGTALAGGSSEVLVTVNVRPVSGTRLFPLVAVQSLGLGANLVADVEPAGIEVLLAGALPVLQATRAEQVSATVDLAGKGPGTYQVEALVRAPAGTTATAPNGARIAVTVRSR